MNLSYGRTITGTAVSLKFVERYFLKDYSNKIKNFRKKEKKEKVLKILKARNRLELGEVI